MRLLLPVASFTYRARYWLLALFVVLFAAAAAYGIGVSKSLTVGGFDDPRSESYRANERMEAVFGEGQPEVIVAYSRPGSTYRDPDFQHALEATLADIAAVPGVHRVGTPYGPSPSALVSNDGRIVVVTLQLGGRGASDQATYERIAPLLHPDGFETLVGGTIPASNEAQSAASRDLARAEMITLPLLAVLLVIFFRGVVLACLPLLIGGFAVSAALAWVRVLAHGFEVSIFAMNIVTFVGLGVAVDYALFMTSRFRDELAHGCSVEVAVRHTLMTAGRTIGYSGFAVMSSLLGMLVFPMMLLRSVAVAGTLVVLMALIATLVFLPAGLSVLGHRINMLSFGQPKEHDEWHGLWSRVASAVMRAPVLVTLVVTAILLVLGAPFLRMEEAVSGASVLPANAEARKLDDLMRSGRFPPAATAPIDVVVRTDAEIWSEEGLSELARLTDAIAVLPHVARVDALVGGGGGRTPAMLLGALSQPAAGEALRERLSHIARGHESIVRVGTSAPPASGLASDLVHRIRALDSPGTETLVGGQAARLVDLRDTMSERLPWGMAIVCFTTFVVLFMAFGSVFMPIKAIITNILSLTASFGALVFIFQEGRFESLLHFRSPGNIELTVPVVMFAVVFGLSMDYELFLLSRIREAYEVSGDTHESVMTGLKHTGKIITRAAILLVAVMIGFISADMLLVKELGVGMTVAIIVDATIVRLLLVPATMQLLGHLNWWAPRFLTRAWKRLGIGVDERSPADIDRDLATHKP
jgi:RND superfamily putative drug exporter